MARLRTLSGYGIGDFGLNIYWNTISLYLVYWYTTVVGIPAEVAGTIFFIGMIWDAISDPIVASLSERVRSRHGTYRPFLLYGSVGLAACFVLLFWVPPFEGMLLIAVLIFTAILFRTAYTLVAIPYSAMSVRLTYKSVERTQFSGVRMFFAFGGLLVVSNFLPPLIRYFSGGPDYTASGFQAAAVVGGALATFALVACFLGTKEQPLPDQTVSTRLVPSELFQTLRQNRALLILLLVIFLQSGATASLMISLVFFIETNQPAFASKEIVLTAFAIATMCGVPLWTLLIRQLGKKNVWIIASVLVACFGAHMLFFGPSLIGGVPVQVIGTGFCIAAFAVLLWSFIPDTVEYGQLASGSRSEGVVFGSVLVVQKLSGGFMGFIVGIVLGAIGYDAGLDQQSEQAGQGLIAFLAICPSLLLFLSIIPILALPLDRRIHADIVAQLAQRGSRNLPEERPL